MTETTPLLRSFVAVPLPGAVQTAIAEAARGLARELPRGDIKWSNWSKKPENLHVTMKFLGAVAVDRLEAVGVALGAALADVPPFRFVVRGFDAFPAPARAEVLFAGIADPERRMTALSRIVETVAARFGFSPEERPFTAHVTVGRSQKGVDARAALAPLAARELGEVAVDEVHVYESQLGRTRDAGSTYVLRHRARLSTQAN